MLSSTIGDHDITEREFVSLQFARKLATQWLALNRQDYDALAEVFTLPECAEIVGRCAWTYGGARMMSSWGAEGYKHSGQIVLEALPVRLAYADTVASETSLPSIPWPPLRPVEDIIRRAEERLSPPPIWLRYLAPNLTVLNRWNELYRLSVESGVLEARIKQLLRVLLAHIAKCPDWAPPESPSLVAAGIDLRDRRAILAGDLEAFAPREHAALQYGWALGMGSHISDSAWENVAEQFSPKEIVELGYAVAIQNGAVRAFRGMITTA